MIDQLLIFIDWLSKV